MQQGQGGFGMAEGAGAGGYDGGGYGGRDGGMGGGYGGIRGGYASMGGMGGIVDGQWFRLAVASGTSQTRQSTVTALAFDPFEELLWSATRDGRITCHHSQTLERYVSFMAHKAPVLKLVPIANGMSSVSTKGVRFHTRGGLLQSEFSRENTSIRCCCLPHQKKPRLVLFGKVSPNEQKSQEGGQHPAASFLLFDMNLATGRISNEVTVEDEIVCIKAMQKGSQLVCATSSGSLELRDGNTFSLLEKTSLFSGPVSDLDVKKGILVCCGYSKRGNDAYTSLMPDKTIKVLDAKTFKHLNPIAFPSGAVQVFFLPKFSSTFMAVSHAGRLQLLEAQAEYQTHLQVYALEPAGAVACMAVSSTGESLAFGDEGGLVHQWADRQSPQINVMSQPTELVDNELHKYGIYLDLNAPLAFVPEGWAEEKSLPLSTWTGKAARTFQPVEHQNPIDDSLIPGLTWNGFLGVAKKPNLKTKRGTTEFYNIFNAARKESEKMMRGKKGSNGSRVAPYKVPRGYAKVKINIPKLGLMSFDFSSYNKSHFTGLDNLLPNSYANALIQTLYFNHSFRVHMLNHLCEKVSCLSCELGFLFHMLDCSRSGTAEPRNFLRILRQIPEASALGLLDKGDGNSDMLVAHKIQDFNRFVLEHIHKEQLKVNKIQAGPDQKPDPTVVESLFGAHVSKTVDCQSCHETTHFEDQAFHLKISYPQSRDEVDFTSLLANSMFERRSFRVWCNKCKAYKKSQQTRSYRSLPNVLSVNCNIKTDSELSHWKSAGPPAQTHGSSLLSKFESVTVADKEQPGGESLQVQVPKTAPKRVMDVGWLPHKISVKLPDDPGSAAPALQRVLLTDEEDEQSRRLETAAHQELKRYRQEKRNSNAQGKAFKFTPKQSRKGKHSPSRDGGAASPSAAIFQSSGLPNSGDRQAEYRLTAVVSHVADPPEDESALSQVIGEHLVANVRVPAQYERSLYQEQSRTPRQRASKPELSPDWWFLFNDFVIHPSEGAATVNFSPVWKQPCILQYTRVDTAARLETSEEVVPLALSDALYRNEPSLSLRLGGVQVSQTFWPLQPTEPLRFVAIDCEFVAVEKEETVVKNGKTKVLKPSRLTLARISCVRGDQTPNIGKPFIDDYITPSEPVVDYLTRYSGIQPGDLDRSVSPHHLVSLKTAYVKLRSLCDRGAVFIGHGLKKDFQMINIVVPQRQVIDTVDLFYLKNRRRLGLSFLCHHLLNTDIQEETHDSIEDARTALALYRRYQELKMAGMVEKTLQELYNIGERQGFKVGQ